MKPKQHAAKKPATVNLAAPPESNVAKVRAVAFKIKNRVFAGDSGDSHGALYASLLRSKQVPADTLDLWTADDTNHGFVTESGEFLNRPEIARRFGTSGND